MGVVRAEVTFPGNIQAICSVATSYARARGFSVEAGYLERGRVSLAEPEFDNWDGGTWRWPVRVELEPADFSTIEGPEQRRQVETNLSEILDEMVLDRYRPHFLSMVRVLPRLNVVAPEGVNNQGWGHSRNPAPIVDDNLRFRSWPEAYLCRALKRRGVLISPLPVFITPRRVEPDFLVFHDGITLIVEIDGPKHTETPVEAQDRILPFIRQGVLPYRVEATSCATDAQADRTAAQILEHIATLKAAR